MRSIRPLAAPLQTNLEVGDSLWAWTPGTRPGMTCWGCKRRSRIRSLKADDELVQQLLGRADIDGFKAFGDLFVYGLQYPPGVDQLSLR
jgi:hypothetical protein